MKRVHDRCNNVQVHVVLVKGGWTTVRSDSGHEYKLRNGQIETIVADKVVAGEIEKDTITIMDAAKDSGIHKIKDSVVNLRKYVETKTAAGRTSLDCGDKVAKQLRQKTLNEVYAIAAPLLGVDEEELRTKYEHLNPGMVRMCIGNKLRAI